MAVEKQMTPFEIEGQEDSEALEIEIVNPEAVSIETEDGDEVTGDQDDMFLEDDDDE